MTDDESIRSSDVSDTDPQVDPVPIPGYTVPAQELPADDDEPESVPADRVWFHVAWEAALLVLVAGGVGVWWLLGRDTDLLGDPELLGDRMYAVAPFLLLATALAASVRVRSANLAVGAVAALAALLFVKWEDDGQLIAVALVLAAVVAVTAALVVAVPVLRVPGWAASLGAAVAVLATATAVADDSGFEVAPSAGGVLTSLPESGTVTVAGELTWVVVGVVMAVSVLGGAIGALRPVRRRLLACREAAASPARWELPAVLTTGAGLLVSNLLAAAAGVLLVIPSDRVAGAAEVPAGTLEVAGVALALALVLLGGTSMWGRRGGVFGTLLAALVVFAVYAAFADLGWTEQGHWIVVGALALGLVVNWLVETLAVRSRRRTEPPLPTVDVLAAPEPEPEPEADLTEPEESSARSEPLSSPR